MALTDLAIKAAKPSPDSKTPRKLSDSAGLQLWIMPTGAKYWRFSYRWAGKQKTLSLGVYPEMALAAAREARDAARKLLTNGVDPSANKKTIKAARLVSAETTFEAIANELRTKKAKEGKAGPTLDRFDRFIRLCRPAIGSRPISDLARSTPEVLALLRKVEEKGHGETVIKLRGFIGEVCRYAMATGRADNDPTVATRNALVKHTREHRAAITESAPFGALLRAIEAYEGAAETCAALEILAHTFVRPGELRLAEWQEFNLEDAVWTIPASRMKMRRRHFVPLSPRVVAILTELKAQSSSQQFVFPSLRSKGRPISENTLNTALRAMGYSKEQMTAHGFRAAASSMLNQSGKFQPDAIERQLSHEDEDDQRKPYNRADYWDERVRMMFYWSDRCATMKAGGDVIEFRKVAHHG